MLIERPFVRTCRPFGGGVYGDGGFPYVLHPGYARAAPHYIRSFQVLVQDLRELFDYIEPADANAGTFSFRTHALLLRACVEVEANCKAILKENGYARADDANMVDYRKIEVTHRLSGFKVVLPHWAGAKGVRAPFAAWQGAAALPWYRAYNATKHDRQGEFEQASFGHVVDACCAVLVVLSAQFGNEDFSNSFHWERAPAADGSLPAIGGYGRVIFPNDWPSESRYGFDWPTLQDRSDAFQQFDYSTL